MGDENNSSSAAKLNSPADPVVKTRSQFLVYFWKDLFFSFFHVSYSSNSDYSNSAYFHSGREQENAPKMHP